MLELVCPRELESVLEQADTTWMFPAVTDAAPIAVSPRMAFGLVQAPRELDRLLPPAHRVVVVELDHLGVRPDPVGGGELGARRQRLQRLDGGPTCRFGLRAAAHGHVEDRQPRQVIAGAQPVAERPAQVDRAFSGVIDASYAPLASASSASRRAGRPARRPAASAWRRTRAYCAAASRCAPIRAPCSAAARPCRSTAAVSPASSA